jgi:hypothetical protein
MNTGITSSLKLIGRSTAASFTATGTLTAWPPNSTINSVAPSAPGMSTFFSTFTSDGFASVNFASAVTSRVIPSAKVACTTNDC